MKKHLLIAGGTGLIGSALKAEAVQLGWEVTLLSRKGGKDMIKWDPSREWISLEIPHAYDAVINLAGASIAGRRWTSKRKQFILDSRTQACRTLEKYLSSGALKTTVYIGVSGIGYYGDSGDMQVDETSATDPRSGWMSDTVVQWEAAHNRIASIGIRTVILRTGIVLSMQGGALKEILQTNRLGVLFYFGNGRQYLSWIHMKDLTGIILASIQQERMSGTYLTVAPTPVSNKGLTQTASRQYAIRRLILPAPVFILRLVLGKMHRVLLESCRGYPTRLLEEGFEFRFPTIDEALADLMRKLKRSKE